jgi:hypothetical protein
MQKVNLSIIIPVFKRYKKVYDLLFSLKHMQFNNIILLCDYVTDDVSTTTYKNAIATEFPQVTSLIQKEHGGTRGMVRILEHLESEERYVWLEDDLIVGDLFFHQCELFFNQLYSNLFPIFIGYSRTNNASDEFFRTYSCIPMWGIATYGKHLQSFINFYLKTENASVEEKTKIINSILDKKFDCEYFEKHKEMMLQANRDNIFEKTYNLDSFFWIHLLLSNQAVIKNQISSVFYSADKFARNKTIEYKDDSIKNPIEMDILNGAKMWR